MAPHLASFDPIRGRICDGPGIDSAYKRMCR